MVGRCLAALTLILTGLEAGAQSPTPAPTPERRGIWEAWLPTGKYIVRHDAVTSVSRHEYVVDGAGKVTEVNIGTTGSELVRFYFIEPNVPQPSNGLGQSGIEAIKEKTQAAADRVSDASTTVVKSYPASTHAHTVEYRLSSKATLDNLFVHFEKWWLDRGPNIFKP